MTQEGRRAMPFWSSKARVERIIRMVTAYSGFEPVEVSWEDFCTEWPPHLRADGLLVGVNWSGKYATGYDVEVDQLLRNVQHYIDSRTDILHFTSKRKS